MSHRYDPDPEMGDEGDGTDDVFGALIVIAFAFMATLLCLSGVGIVREALSVLTGLP